MNTFELTKSFCEAFGQVSQSKLENPEDWPLEANLRVALIFEELLELMTALGVSNVYTNSLQGVFNLIEIDPDYVRDNSEVADALADLDVVVNNAGIFFEMPMDKLAKEVYNSNMSKICKDEETADETIKSYAENRGIKAGKRKNSQGDWVVYNLETSKILKSIKFKEPNFKGII